MLGVATPSLGSWASMVIQAPTLTQTQYVGYGGGSAFPIGIGKCSGARRSSSHYQQHSSRQGLVSLGSFSNCCSLFPSFSYSSSVKTAVAAVDSGKISSSDVTEKQQPNKYYFVIANANFMLDEEEHFQELMFERLRNYEERNREQDFWLVIEPKFLDKFPSINKRLRRPAVALVSTNGTWIKFMKLRLDRVLSESFEADSLEEALAFNPTNLEFEKPENWVAPYPKYEFGWWEPFLPPGSKEEVKV